MKWGYTGSTMLIGIVVLLILLGREINLGDLGSGAESAVNLAAASLSVDVQQPEIRHSQSKENLQRQDEQFQYRKRIKVNKNSSLKNKTGSLTKEIKEESFKSKHEHKGIIPEISLSYVGIDPTKISTCLGFQLIAAREDKIICGIDIADFTLITMTKQRLAQYGERGLSADNLPFTENVKNRIAYATGVSSDSLTLIFLLPLDFQSYFNRKIMDYLQKQNIESSKVDYLTGAFQILDENVEVIVTGYKLL